MFASAGVAAWERWPPAALWHLVFAAGALPMILAAMAYFVPVLTRTRMAPRALAALPFAAFLAGLSIVAWFVQGGEIVQVVRIAAPWAAFAIVAGFAFWMERRRRACLGRAHPCLRWYAAALACLGMGLVAVGVSPWLPEHATALRLFHLHINTLGFIGLTAAGTLKVLLPTVIGKPNPAVADFFAPRQPAPLLLAAVAGLAISLLHGIAHGLGMPGGRDALPLFVIGFLLPLVSGAVAQLLPVWLRPGIQTEWHRSRRSRLSAFARTRAALLLVAGPLAAAGSAFGYGLGIAAALWLLAAMALATFRR